MVKKVNIFCQSVWEYFDFREGTDVWRKMVDIYQESRFSLLIWETITCDTVNNNGIISRGCF